MCDLSKLIEFSNLYNGLKNKNRKLSDIRIIICDNMNITNKTVYYRTLRECREKKFILDSYHENMRKFLNTLSCKKHPEHNGQISHELLLKWIDEFLINYEDYLKKDENNISNKNNSVQKIIYISIEQLKELLQDFFH